MSRLVEYFVVVGVNGTEVTDLHPIDKSKADLPHFKQVYRGDLIDRFPERDWKDCPLPPGLAMFCAPDGKLFGARSTFTLVLVP